MRSQSDPRENVSPCRSPLCGSRRRKATSHHKKAPHVGVPSYANGFDLAEFLPRGRAVRSRGDPRENVSPCRSSLCDSRRREATGHTKEHPMFEAPSYANGFDLAEFLPRGRAVRSRGDPRENVSPCRSSLCDSRRRKATGHTKEHPMLGVLFCGDSWQNRTAVSALRGPCLSRLTNEPFFACKLL